MQSRDYIGQCQGNGNAGKIKMASTAVVDVVNCDYRLVNCEMEIKYVPLPRKSVYSVQCYIQEMLLTKSSLYTANK